MGLRRVFILAVIPVIFLGGIWWAMSSEKPSGSGILESRQSLQRAVTFRDKFYDAAVVKDEAWIVGYYGTILHLKETPPLWERQSSSTTLPLFGVSFTDKNNGIVVGKRGLTLWTENSGLIWKAGEKKTDKSLFSVYLVNPKQGWAVGEFGTIIHTADGGKTWQDRSIKEDISLNKCFFMDANTGWIVGEFSTILYTRNGGISWHFKQRDEKGVSFNDILFKNKQEGLIAGENGVLFQTRDGGQTWKRIKLPQDENFLGIGILDDKFYVVGLRGTIIQEAQDRSFKSNHSIMVPDWLGRVIAFPSGLGIIAGDHARILYSLKGQNRHWAILN